MQVYLRLPSGILCTGSCNYNEIFCWVQSRVACILCAITSSAAWGSGLFCADCAKPPLTEGRSSAPRYAREDSLCRKKASFLGLEILYFFCILHFWDSQRKLHLLNASRAGQGVHSEPMCSGVFCWVPEIGFAPVSVGSLHPFPCAPNAGCRLPARGSGLFGLRLSGS